MKPSFSTALLVICLSIAPTFQLWGNIQGPVTFGFSGFIQYQQRGPVTGLAVGNTFQGSFTFDPLTPGTPHTPVETSLDTDYAAIRSWNVTVLESGLTFQGTVGTISLGNNTAFLGSDRYIVTMHLNPDDPAIMVAGHRFGLFQIDLFTYGFGTNATLLSSSALPTTPPSLVPDDGNFYQRRGRFVFDDASFQNRMLTLVPEPSPLVLIVGGVLMAACLPRRTN